MGEIYLVAYSYRQMDLVRNLRREGAAAEDRAANFLLEMGYTIVTRRWKTTRGELDLVCLDGSLLVFVEVKARMAPGYLPEDSITDAKRRSLGRAAHAYLASIGEPERACRFDLIAIDADGLRHWTDILQ